MINYEYTEGRRDVPIAVRINGRLVGTIKPVDGGWCYFPFGHTKLHGDTFPTVAEVQKSLGEGL